MSTATAPDSVGRTRAVHLPADAHTAVAAWITALLIGAFALMLRLHRLGAVKTLIFDETYYVKDGYTLTQRGVEMDWPENPNPAFEAGDVSTFLDSGAYVVHPPLGKWLIGLGQMALGADDPVGWRISAAVAGTISIIAAVLIVRRLLGSLLLGALTGFFMAIDGAHLVHSRTSLLDLFLMVFVLLAFGALLLDRDRADARIAAGLPLGARGWRLTAGVLLGAACSVKWSGLYVLAFFGILTVVWDWMRRRRARDPHWFTRGFVRDAIPAFLQTVPVAALVYLASWTGWFVSGDGWGRRWAESNGHASAPGPVRALISWWHYHQEAYRFHVGLDSGHTYEASPLGWLLQLRPTLFLFTSSEHGQNGCTAQKCAEVITSVGNPVLWWAAALSIPVLLVTAVWRRDGRAAAILTGIGAGYLPWLMYLNRTVFTFYTIVFEPFMVMALVYVLGLLIGPRLLRARARRGKRAASPAGGAALFAAGDEKAAGRRQVGAAAAGSLTCLIILVSAFFWPVWTGEMIPYEQWQWRIWLDSWS